MGELSHLIPTLIKNDEEGMLIIGNQPKEIEAKIVCGCGGLSNPLRVFFSEELYLKAVNDLTLADRVRSFFYFLAPGSERGLELLGGCQECGRLLGAVARFVEDL